MKFTITGIGTATPRNFITQKELLEHFMSNCILSQKEKQLYTQLLTGGQIKGRYVGARTIDELLCTDPDHLIGRFRKYGTSTAVEAARKAMDNAGVSVKDIRGLVVNTCTGYLCPGLSSYISEELGLSGAIGIRDIMGMGCGAAIPNLESACGMVSVAGKGPVLGIAVEICSATIFPAHDPGLIVSNCIFGDGAAAYVIDSSGKSGRNKLATIIGFESGNYPEFREELRYVNESGLLRNRLSVKVPVIGARTVSEVTTRLLSRFELSKEDIGWWVVHPGGSLVLAQVEKKMRLPKNSLDFSYEVFENYGNMSSPSVLFVLERILKKGHPGRGQKGLMLSFGAGFTSFAALLEF